MRKLMQSFQAALALGCAVVLGACSTPSRYVQVSEQVSEIKQLATAKKCAEAIKIFDEIKKEFTDQPYSISNVATTSVYGFPQCLINAGRAEEVIGHFEMACLPGRRSPLTALEQTYICTDYSLKDAAAVAYKAVGRENPFEKNGNVAEQMTRNKEVIKLVDNERSSIYKRTVDQSRYDVGTSAGARQYHREMRAAALSSISFIDRQIQKCHSENNAWCLRYLSEQRKSEAAEVETHSQYIKESEEDHAAAQRIARAAPAILGAVAGAGAIYAGGNSASSAQARPGASTAASEASEICPLSEPGKSQCNARNAARRGGLATSQSGGSAQGLPAQARTQSSTPASPQPQQQQGSPAASRASGFVYDPQDHSACVQFQAVQDNRPDSGLAYGSYIQKNVCPYRVKYFACVTALNRDGKNLAQFNQHLDGNKCPGGGFGASELDPGESRTSRTWFQYSQIRFNSMVCKPEWNIVGTDDRNTIIQYIGQRYRCRKLA